MASEVVAGGQRFFNVTVPGGSCSGLNTSVTLYGYTFTIDLESVLCSSMADALYALMAIGIMLGATFAAFRIAYL